MYHAFKSRQVSYRSPVHAFICGILYNVQCVCAKTITIISRQMSRKHTHTHTHTDTHTHTQCVCVSHHHHHHYHSPCVARAYTLTYNTHAHTHITTHPLPPPHMLVYAGVNQRHRDARRQPGCLTDVAQQCQRRHPWPSRLQRYAHNSTQSCACTHVHSSTDARSKTARDTGARRHGC